MSSDSSCSASNDKQVNPNSNYVDYLPKLYETQSSELSLDQMSNDAFLILIIGSSAIILYTSCLYIRYKTKPDEYWTDLWVGYGDTD